MLCGIKSYSTGLPWLTVLVPTDPLTQNFELQVTTNDYNLTGITSVSLVVTFADVNLTQSITETLSVTLLHPSKTTIISSTQTIPNLLYTFGDAALQQAFTEFTDSVSTQYGVVGLCALNYALSPSGDATTYGVLIVNTPPNYFIQVLTTDPLLIG